jgi:hypothetical protein
MGIFQALGKLRSNIFTMSPREVQEAVAKSGQAASYVAGNKTEAIQHLTNGVIDSGKGVICIHSGGRVGVSIFKGVKDYFRGDVVCSGLCVVSGMCETTAGVLIWVPIPGKICVVSGLKGVSLGCMKIRDLCAADPTNPLC